MYSFDIGARIKQLRTAARMTQEELAEGIVTRNQLSLIESGKSSPSINTLFAICERLNVSIQFFFSSKEEKDTEVEKQLIEKMYESFRDGKWGKCLELYQKTRRKDISADYIYIISAYKSALDDFSEGRYSVAKDLFQTCIDKIRENKFRSNNLYEKSMFFINYIDGKTESMISSPEAGDEFLLYFKAMNYIKQNPGSIDTGAINILPLDTLFKEHLKAIVLLQKGEYSASYDILKNLLRERLPAPLRKNALKDMIDICNIVGNHKEAYLFETELKGTR